MQNENELDDVKKQLDDFKKQLDDWYGDSTQVVNWYRNATAYAREVYHDKYQEYYNKREEYQKTKKLNKFTIQTIILNIILKMIFFKIIIS